MRIAPLVFFMFNRQAKDRYEITRKVSSITHAHPISITACFIFIELLNLIRKGRSKRAAYANTKAAEHEADTPVSMLSRIYSQSICRPTCSIYILNDDKLLLFMSGCSITQNTVRLQRETGQMFTFEFQGQRMGWAGCSEVAADPSTSTIQLKTGGADAYTVGGYTMPNMAPGICGTL